MLMACVGLRQWTDACDGAYLPAPTDRRRSRGAQDRRDRLIRASSASRIFPPIRINTRSWASKCRHQLDMRRIEELVDRRHAREPVAAVDQDAGVAREGRGVEIGRAH